MEEHRFDDGAPHPPVKYCQWCDAEEGTEHKRDCPAACEYYLEVEIDDAEEKES